MMNKANLVRTLKPFAIGAVVFLVLRYTGIIAGVSTITQQALIQSGALDANVENTTAGKKFDYNFALYDLNKNKIDVNNYKGKTIFLNVWATWCGPCRAEMPSIQSLYTKLDKKNIEFIMLSLDNNDSFDKVTKYIADKNFTFPAFVPAGELPQLLQVRSIPITFVINKTGEVVYKETGTANYDTEKFKKFLEEL